MMDKQEVGISRTFCLETTKLKTIVRLKVLIPKELYS